MSEYKYRNGVLKPKRKIFTHQRVVAGLCIVFAILAFSNIRYFRDHIPGLSHVPPIIHQPGQHGNAHPPIAGKSHDTVHQGHAHSGTDRGAPHKRTSVQVDLGRNKATVQHSGSHSAVLASGRTNGSHSSAGGSTPGTSTGSSGSGPTGGSQGNGNGSGGTTGGGQPSGGSGGASGSSGLTVSVNVPPVLGISAGVNVQAASTSPPRVLDVHTDLVDTSVKKVLGK